MSFNDQDIERITKEFITSVDKGIEFQKDINVFADEITPKVITTAYTGTNFTAMFNGKNLGFSMKAEYKTYAVRLFDNDEFIRLKIINAEHKAVAKVARFVPEPNESLVNQVHNVIVMLLFDFFDVEISPEEIED